MAKVKVYVRGGIGDQICAEPSLRILRTLHSDDEITLVTAFPEIFKHIPFNIVETVYPEFIREDEPGFLTYHSYRADRTPARQWLNHFSMHTVDFCSMNLLGGTLPLYEKQIELPFNYHTARCQQEWAKCLTGPPLLIHAGLSWRSRTFPIYWWDEVISKLNSHFQIILIGQDCENSGEKKGTLPIKIPPTVCDLRGTLSFQSTVELMRVCSARDGILLTNDSAPVHMAGATAELGIICPMTCRAPDHVFPYRYGTPWYKTHDPAWSGVYAYEDKKKYSSGFSTAEMPRGINIIDWLPVPESLVQEVITYQKRWSEGNHEKTF